MCADEMGLQWIMDAWAGKPRPTNTSPGLIYMLNGAVQHSYTDPFDRTSPLIPIGPHWMLIWPFEAEATGLSTVMRDAGTMIMYAGTPYAHLHICGDPWEGNEYHPDSEAVWTMTYHRIRFPAVPPRESRTDVALSLWRAHDELQGAASRGCRPLYGAVARVKRAVRHSPGLRCFLNVRVAPWAGLAGDDSATKRRRPLRVWCPMHTFCKPEVARRPSAGSVGDLTRSPAPSSVVQ